MNNTPILKVITEYCSVYVDDIRLQELTETDPALYARKMWQYLRASIPLFTLPEGIQNYLCGTEESPKLTEPLFAEGNYVAENDLQSGFVISLGSSYEGYDLCSCRMKTKDAHGNVVYVPVSVSYNTANGEVTLNEEIHKHSVLDFDLYKDGWFTEMLSPQIMMVLGMCFNVVWQTRFMNDWLSNVDKVEDKSFSQQNRSNKIRADQERYLVLRQELSAQMRKLEQTLYFREAFPLGGVKIH